MQQLQAGDFVQSVDAIQQTNDEASSLLFGTPVYNDVDDGVKKASAGSAVAKNVIGLVANGTIAAGTQGAVLLSGPLTGTTGQWDAVFGTTGGLTKGTHYFLSETAGAGTDICPSNGGSYVVELGVATSPTTLVLKAPFQSILL